MPETDKNWTTAGNSTTTPTSNTQRKELTVKVPDITCEIIEVRWESGIDIARNKSKVTAPHWETGKAVDEEDKHELQRYKTGSQKPGVYLVKSKKGKDEFTVKVKVTKNNTKHTEGKLVGTFGTLTFEGKCPLAVGTNTAKIKIKAVPDVLTHIEGDATWQLQFVDKSKLPLKDKTRLELFVVFDKPMDFYKQGVWVEALRLLFIKAKVGGISKSEDAAKRVTKYCHTSHGMEYDTVRGAPAFFGGSPKTGSGSFSLMNYIQKTPSNIVNCYDQAAVVQALCGALGILVDWHYLAPYGYISITNLIGVGSCNNPFYKGNGSNPIEKEDSPNRTAFGNHAFIGLSGKIHDGCAGPHLGSENPKQYLDAAIDSKRTASELGISIKAPSTLGSILESGYLLKTVGITGVD